MRGPAVRPIVIAAGGTGGHFFPAEALARALLHRGHRIALMTDARSGGLTNSVFEGYERFVLSGSGIAGRNFLKGARSIAALVRGIAQARAILNRLGAPVVVGFGGYPCVPPVLGARFAGRRIGIILHEQNAVMGRANRFLAPRADVLALSFAATRLLPPGVRTELTGNPVRPAVGALASIPYAPPTDRLGLLVLGGSLGARVFSDMVPAALAKLPDLLRRRLSVVQQCRQEDLERVRLAYERAGLDAELSTFFPDVADRLAAAHLVIARAGASTVAELAVAGRPAILVPLPGAIDDHQTANAAALAEAGGAWVMPQPGFTAESLTVRLAGLLTDPAALAAAAAAARTQARTDAAARLADVVEHTLSRMPGMAGERT
ncbi:undecaprenyldiphospho-muramoylpentapeptide beta-N-acetylglucosaminyltransferase [Rhodopila sp.]|uniref:undecaprenyldiphospho-muramoylpentapeptide beta-N-acetylglucosaminyltransferase n=1 Tax=Rhodopila sp. TaxID=2480087 RepID=UPI0038D1FEEC